MYAKTKQSYLDQMQESMETLSLSAKERELILTALDAGYNRGYSDCLTENECKVAVIGKN